MTVLATRRLTGLAHRGPALLMFLLVLLPLALLSACRNHWQEQQFQGVSLGTAYHLTLYAELTDSDREALELGILGELARLETQHAWLDWLLNLAVAPPVVAWLPSWLPTELDSWMHALAVDRLAARLMDEGFRHAMIEVGGIVRVLDSPRREGWSLALDHATLPAEEGARALSLRQAALVNRLVAPPAEAPKRQSRVLAVSVVAATASEAWHEARRLTSLAPPFAPAEAWTTAGTTAWTMESAARLVVSTPEGIHIHYTPALERWLEP